jgi:hypothetical protein
VNDGASHEAARIARALHEGASLADAIGIPLDSLEAARSLARWAEAIDEPSLAIAIWEGCAALDETSASWLGLAHAALRAGDAVRAFGAAGHVMARAHEPRERAEASLLSARACFLAGRTDDARAWLATLRELPDAGPPGPLERALRAHH